MFRLKRCTLFATTAAAVLFAVEVIGRGEQPTQSGADNATQESTLVEFEKLELPSYVDRSVTTLPVPEPVRKQAGRRIRMRVYMMFPAEEGALGYLVGVPEIPQNSRRPARKGMCASPSELKYLRHSVAVLLREGITIEWDSRRPHFPLLIEGVLHVEGDQLNLEFGGADLYLDDATYRDVEPQEDYGPLWTLFGC